jgi:predicted alpha/beta hydrolase family esterase
MIRVILLHGNGGGTGKDNWFPYIQKGLEEVGIICLAPDLPDPVGAHSNVWLPYIKNELKADENTVLVGHSSGAIAAMRFAEQHKLAGSVLIGTYYSDLGYEDEKESGYFDMPWEWEKIKNNQKWVAIFASDDDPYINISEPKFIRDQLDAVYFELKNEGHFGGSSHPKREFPELLDFLKKKLLS